jgi:phage host-nuclease inhibitor protein Gam
VVQNHRNAPTPNPAVPRDEAEADKALAEIGDAQRRVATAQVRAEKRIAAIQAQLARDTAADRTLIDNRLNGLYLWAKAKQQSSAGQEAEKTIKLASGVLSWRQAPPHVEINGNDETIIAWIRRRRSFAQFIKTTHTLRRQAMIQNRVKASQIPGVSLVSDMMFYAQPAGATSDDKLAIRDKTEE